MGRNWWLILIKPPESTLKNVVITRLQKRRPKEAEAEAEAEARDAMISLAENKDDSSSVIPNVTARGTGDCGQKSIHGKTKRCWNVAEDDSDADKDAMQKIHGMIEERTKIKPPGSSTPVQPSSGTVDKSGDDDDTKKRRQMGSTLEERKSRRLLEKEEHLEEREAMEVQGWKDREVAAAGKPSLQIDAASSMHVPIERESTVKNERKCQRRERDGFHKSNGEEKGIVPGLVSDKAEQQCPSRGTEFGNFQQCPSRESGFWTFWSDYSTEELKAVQGNSSTGATAEFSKHISVSNPREERSEENDRSGRRSDKCWASGRDTEQHDKYGARFVNESRKDIHDQATFKSEDNKTLDAKQLLATVPQTKEELFA